MTVSETPGRSSINSRLSFGSAASSSTASPSPYPFDFRISHLNHRLSMFAFDTVHEQNVYGDVKLEKNLSLCRVKCINALESMLYSGFVGIVISVNVLVVIAETNARAASEQVPPWIAVASLTMLVIFILDGAARIFALRGNIIYSGQDLFDLLLLTFDIVVELTSSYTNQEASSSALRTLRMFRVVRVIRNLLMFRELYLMIKGLLSALRTIVFASFLITMVIMMFAVLAVQFVHPVSTRLESNGKLCDACVGAYSSVQNSMLTMFSTIIAGDSWGIYNNDLIRESPLAALILIGATVTIVLGLLNLIVAVIVDRAQAARAEDYELMHILKQEELRNAYSRLKRVFEDMDEDGNGSLSPEELFSSFDHCETFRHEMELMDINKDDLNMVFELLDDDCDGLIGYDEFVQQLHVIRHANPHTLLVILSHKAESMHKEMSAQITSMMSRLEGVGENVERTVGKLLTEDSGLWMRDSVTPETEDISCSEKVNTCIHLAQQTCPVANKEFPAAVNTRKKWSAEIEGAQPCVRQEVLDGEVLIPI